ncbi:prephenate dehydrogenase/arogenate dehydrogenase family protein [Reinekea marinisedimentorum]|uniref:prephenate dehydrogenase n=1 Tax=Reinekea marinisedimentorum TaxID=230495 RepID=A0A4R3I4H3_9GAMM|nr:prephenate dehydrogenase/arogenate dehydrogenase family protein [Reinekea marinisedimentorum]TCS39983.1 3-phosphoshikimate 1-carboxyvinyltransferase [Reinekea marinisedimentorum]
MNDQPKVLVIGLGLIGASFAKALKTRGEAYVYGYNRREGVAAQAKELGVIDEVVDNLSELPDVDCIVIGVPVLAIAAVIEAIKPALDKVKAITDVGSVKGEVVNIVRQQLGYVPASFVPGHPIAGAEKSGLMAANDQLFENHMLIVTPLEETSAEATTLVSRLWSACGAEVVSMPVARHDEVLAATSHLPHLLAFSLVDTLSRESENREIFKYAAGGFRDFSRIAASDPTMWHDIFLTNQDALLAVLRRFQADLSQLEGAIERGDGDYLKVVFERAKASRDHFSDILEARKNKK